MRTAPGPPGLAVIPESRVAARPFARVIRCRCLVRDCERTIAHQPAMVTGATVGLMALGRAPTPALDGGGTDDGDHLSNKF